jgi:Ca-activated chloride channel homolog
VEFRAIGRQGVSRFGRSFVLASAFLMCMLAIAAMSAAQNSSPASPTPEPSNPQTPTSPAIQASAEDDDQNGFVFKKAIEEVVLHAIVVDSQNRLITDLSGNSFAVYEDGKPQGVTSFRKERVPIALGILIDNSGSMLPKRAKVNEAALELVGGSQEGDRVFVVNFGEDAFLDQDYTQDVGKLRAALQQVETRGSTALYDAVVAAVDHLNQTSPLQKKILLAVTDGHDNASQSTFQEVLRKLQSKNGPVLYTIALGLNEGRADADRQSLTTLSERTGGAAFFPSSLDEIQSIAREIARDIRSQYVITYRSSNPHTAGAYHSIQVQALGGSSPLRVETRTGYYSGELEKDQSQ